MARQRRETEKRDETSLRGKEMENTEAEITECRRNRHEKAD